jgi:hypothetical protein
LEDKVVAQARLIIPSQGYDQRALGAQLDVDARRLQKFCRKRRPACLALAAQGDNSLLTRLGFRAGSEHSGGRVGCACTGRAAIKDLDKSAARRQPPGNTEPDNAGANDSDLWFADAQEVVRHEAAPFADTAAPLAVSTNDGNFCAILQAITGEQVPRAMLRAGGVSWLSEFAHPNFCSNKLAYTLDKEKQEMVFRHEAELQESDFELLRYLEVSASIFPLLFDSFGTG